MKPAHATSLSRFCGFLDLTVYNFRYYNNSPIIEVMNI